jgi:hypothetical protein
MKRQADGATPGFAFSFSTSGRGEVTAALQSF